MTPTYTHALRAARALDDAEIRELHREVSRLARAAYARDPEYQARYEFGMKASAFKVDNWNARVEAFAADRAGLTVTEYRAAKRAAG